MNIKANRPLYVSSASAVLVVTLFTWLSRWRGLGLSMNPSNILSVMSPLLLKAQVPAVDATMIAKADAQFQEYRGETQQYAFAASLSFSLAAAYVGVRALWPFVDHQTFEKLGSHQQWLFLVVDLVLSAALLAGGADGIHSVINSFTTFFDTTAQKAQQSANAPQK